jgi:acetyl-CoA carboxylase biotin carboxyl carrier protein
MDIRKIKKLIDLVKENNIGEIEIKEDSESVHIIANVSTKTTPLESIVQSSYQKELLTEPKDIKPEYNIESPMVGTVYLASAPGAKNFIEVDQKIKIGDTLCLIEAMKTFNKIEADRAGTVTSILVENGQPVEYGQTLFIIE